jgi:threonine dehydrogenase-like Zn-dependent dehydrogenase
MSEGKVDTEVLITHVLPFERALEGFELASKKEAVKVVFGPGK